MKLCYSTDGTVNWSATHARNPEPHLAPGLIIRLAPRYDGNGTYAHDNGTGEVLRLIRPMSDGHDWYLTRDLFSELSECSYDWIVHVSRLRESEVVMSAPPGA